MKNLTTLEQNITSGLHSGTDIVLGIGGALAEIRDRKLYKDAGYRSFEKYLKDTFGISRARAYHLISAARVIDDLRSRFEETELPKNEAVVRPLMKFNKEDLVEIWATVLKNFPEPRREDVAFIATQWKS